MLLFIDYQWRLQKSLCLKMHCYWYFFPMSTVQAVPNMADRYNKTSAITCCRISNCLTCDARWWFLKLVCCIGGRSCWTGVAACHIMWRIWRAVIILCILTLTKAWVRWIFLSKWGKSCIRRFHQHAATLLVHIPKPKCKHMPQQLAFFDFAQ